ncbi:TFIIA-domain-containing protein [Cystobasidium minutum MCA 4210]|uniref:TFIIA-domain-containing protein n=1 Tax=Cystobasidium minutum MCA 4210 TaxID=1397322 RepID=UPI0034CD7910|eukprot:jgi/Rhomi1/168057/fgenesh1_kg.2_\
MSNKVVPQTYRAIIDKVINSVRPDFEENGIEEAVLVALQQSWEARLASSRVADFSSDPRLGAYQRMLPALPEKPAQQSTDESSTQTSQAGQPTASTSSGSAEASTSAPKKEEEDGSNAASTTLKSENGKKPKAINPDSNELGSDLDESDDDLLSDDEGDGAEDGMSAINGVGDGDVIVAVYEKVQRVKNKWKITLKDGVISADGKDYLFGKCQGDFEW